MLSGITRKLTPKSFLLNELTLRVLWREVAHGLVVRAALRVPRRELNSLAGHTFRATSTSRLWDRSNLARHDNQSLAAKYEALPTSQDVLAGLSRRRGQLEGSQAFSMLMTGWTVVAHPDPRLVQLDTGWSVGMPELIAQINPVIRGWGQYYCKAHVRKLFARLDRWILRRLWSHRFKRWRCRGWQRLPERQLYAEMGLVRLVFLIPSLNLRR